MWDLPGPGLEPVFLALAGGFLTTAPPGKSQGLEELLTIFSDIDDPSPRIWNDGVGKLSPTGVSSPLPLLRC